MGVKLFELLKDARQARIAKKALPLMRALPAVGEVAGKQVLHAGTVDENLSRVVMDQLGVLATKYPEVFETVPQFTVVGKGAPKALRRSLPRNAAGVAYSLGGRPLMGAGPEGLGMMFSQRKVHGWGRELSSALKSAEGGDDIGGLSLERLHRENVALKADTVEEFQRRTVSHEFGHYGEERLDAIAWEHAKDMGVAERHRGNIANAILEHPGRDWQQRARWADSDYAETKSVESFAEFFTAAEHGTLASGDGARHGADLLGSLGSGRLVGGFKEQVEAKIARQNLLARPRPPDTASMSRTSSARRAHEARQAARRAQGKYIDEP